mmetsp:Transcript_7606/g.11520  ORF Transcript_7606/g.11520 Transcript_7606/m.11520 type:complete len:88 (+) Transcript_7606:190-453(+)
MHWETWMIIKNTIFWNMNSPSSSSSSLWLVFFFRICIGDDKHYSHTNQCKHQRFFGFLIKDFCYPCFLLWYVVHFVSLFPTLVSSGL